MNKIRMYALALVAFAMTAINARADLTVPTPPDISTLATAGTSVFQAGATLGLTAMALGLVVWGLKRGVSASRGRS